MSSTAPESCAFRLGVNYWPARTAMGWWSAFDAPEVARDFARIAEAQFDSVRIFLTWEDFQPTSARVDTVMVDRLRLTLNLAEDAGLSVMPTLFTGHMSGVNWIPEWALGNEVADARFRVVSGGRVVPPRLASWYADASLIRAQSLFAHELARAVAGHAALWAWDLGNENSNCVVPTSKSQASEWLRRMADALRSADPGALVTVGLHMEDLEHDRNLGPAEAAPVCDFLTMHGYPGYAPWTAGPTDERLLPFLASLTRWLGGGAPVLFSEFGVPTKSGVESEQSASAPELVGEQVAASYLDRALDALRQCGSTGALLWCYSDYAEAIWQEPPLDLAVHERSFGLWRADGTAKPAVAAIQAFREREATRSADCSLVDSDWLDLDAQQYYRAPERELPRLYQRYCLALERA